MKGKNFLQIKKIKISEEMMKTENISVLDLGLGLNEEIYIPEILEHDTINTKFMCGCSFNYYCSYGR